MSSAQGSSRDGGFAVPEALLRLAAEDSATAPPKVEGQPSPAHSETMRRPVVPTIELGMRTAAAAAGSSAVIGVWLHAARIERSLHASSTGITAVIVGALGCGFVAAPFVGLAGDRWGRSRAGAAVAIAGAMSGVLAATSSSMPILFAWIALATASGAVLLVWFVETGPWITGAIPLAFVLGAASTWRWGMLAAVVGVPAALAVWRAPAEPGSAEAAITPTASALRRVQCLPGLIAPGGVIALLLIGGPMVLGGHLQHALHMSEAARRRLFLIAFAGVPVGLLGGSFTYSRPAVAAATLALGGCGFAAAAYVRSPGAVELLWGCAFAAVAAAGVITIRCTSSVVRDSPATSLGLVSLWGLVPGGFAAVALSAMAAASGSSAAQVALGATLVAAAAVSARADRYFGPDVAAASHASRIRAESCLLEVDRIDFSYGARQILFDVTMRIEEGEIAALLGTNGAGKSTLLRLIAGLDHPRAGNIRFHGRDTTFLEAEQIGGLGVALLAGGKMSFPSLTVAENLRVGGHRLRRDGPRLRAATSEAFDLFPVLAERRSQKVGTLSGGEQQMLALARVLLTRPQLLLIDELTLGLAPKAVESLLTIVRRVNAEGTTVLLVEQSANLALTLARRALFLERGEIRFDGPTAELLVRDDLLRPVFLT